METACNVERQNIHLYNYMNAIPFATIDRIFPAIGELQGLRIVWDNEGHRAEDFDLSGLGEIEEIENNPHIPGRADIQVLGECRLPKGSKLLLKRPSKL